MKALASLLTLVALTQAGCGAHSPSGAAPAVQQSRSVAAPAVHQSRSVKASWQQHTNEAVTYVLESGAEGAVHIEQALEYNQDPGYLAQLLVHQLTAAALQRIDSSGLSRRELARRLKTSVPQLYRLLDPTQTRKNISQLVSLLHVLNCDVRLVVKHKSAA